jgi:hypothetical protein
MTDVRSVWQALVGIGFQGPNPDYWLDWFVLWLFIDYSGKVGAIYVPFLRHTSIMLIEYPR